MSSSEPQPIALSTPCLEGREWEYVKQCLDTNWISSAGPFVTRFEQQLAALIGVPHAVATVTGTAALHTAMLICGIEPGDEVLMPTLTFIASANAVRYAGAKPIFFDVEPTHWQLNTELVREFLEQRCERRGRTLMNRATQRPVKAILPVHVLGHPVEMNGLQALARQFDLAIIEDCAESLGASYFGRPVGGFGDVGCFSFNGNKTFSTGGGGMLVTSNATLATRARHLTTQAKSDPAEYVHDEVGFNYRLPNVLAAIGCAQLEQYERFLACKRRVAEEYRDRLQRVPGIRLPTEAAAARSSCWLTTVQVDASTYGRTARELRAWLREAGIESRPLWQPMHLSPAYRDSTWIGTDVAEQLYRECLSLPSSVHLTSDDLRRITDRMEAGYSGQCTCGLTEVSASSLAPPRAA